MMLPAASRGKRQGAEGHALVELDVGADVAGFADDDAGAVVDEEAGADAGAGMDVDAGLGVGMLGHHARNQRHAEQQDLVGDAVNGDGLEAGIAEDDLVEALGGRVALEGGLDVLLQDQADVGHALEQLDGLLLGQGLEIHGHARLGLDAILLVAQARAICWVSLSCRPSIRSPT